MASNLKLKNNINSEFNIQYSDDAPAISITSKDMRRVSYSGAGNPNGALTAEVGSLYINTNDGSGTTLHVKESGSGNTGLGC